MSQSSIVLIASYASDLDVVNAARVSYDTVHEEFEEGDDKLISYLVRNQHGTPFEHTFFKFRIEAPIFVFREWHRHRIGHSYNEMSGRYVELDERYYAPSTEEIRTQTGKAGHYRYEPHEASVSERASERIAAACRGSFEEYRTLIALGVAKEQARCVLPVGTFSQMIWSCNARSLMAFLELRTHERAQKEIRDIAIEAEEIFAGLMPITHQAFVDAGRKSP